MIEQFTLMDRLQQEIETEERQLKESVDYHTKTMRQLRSWEKVIPSVEVPQNSWLSVGLHGTWLQICMPFSVEAIGSMLEVFAAEDWEIENETKPTEYEPQHLFNMVKTIDGVQYEVVLRFRADMEGSLCKLEVIGQEEYISTRNKYKIDCSVE